MMLRKNNDTAAHLLVHDHAASSSQSTKSTGRGRTTALKIIRGGSTNNRKRNKRCLIVALVSVVLVYFMGSFLLIGNHLPLHDDSSSYAFPAAGNLPLLVAGNQQQPQQQQQQQAQTQHQKWKDHLITVSKWLEEEQHHQGKSADERILLKPVTAFLEPALKHKNTNPTSPTSTLTSTTSPLPLRTQGPNHLHKVIYPRIRSCRDVPAKLPIDAGVSYDQQGNVMVTNVGDQLRRPNFLKDIIPHCPVDADPFLPWIHDVFLSSSSSSSSGKKNQHHHQQQHPVVHFIAQNKRRCQTGPKHLNDLQRLEPQVALLQSVPIQRISHTRALEIAPTLWNPNNDSTTTTTTTTTTTPITRYRLVPYEQADADAKYTRFICRFHTWNTTATATATSADDYRLELGETLSEYYSSPSSSSLPSNSNTLLNYELAAFRKMNHRQGGLLTKDGKGDNGKFWTASLLFSCPLPASLLSLTEQQQQQQQQEQGPQDMNWMMTPNEHIPLFHVDIIPIRTLVRFPPSSSSEELLDDNDASHSGYYLSEEQIGPYEASKLSFRPLKAWGENHVLPLPQASGRWENIPLCPLVVPSTTTTTTIPASSSSSSTTGSITAESASSTNSKKPHLLSACLWTAASFRTRGKTDAKQTIDGTHRRLMEWIEFHLMVGFDHIYVYDNSGAFVDSGGGGSGDDGTTTNNATTRTIHNLKPIVEAFPPSQITWIDWPSQVCNNNIPAHENTGERSSQYAAENSCRMRYGPMTEWIASFDTDEYLIPQGKHTSLRSVVEQAENTNILSFPSSRGKLRHAYTKSSGKDLAKLANTTFLQAYNCDGSPIPRPDWADRARKQVYRSDYVINHFVHYSTITQGSMTTYQEAQRKNQHWTRYFRESAPSERGVDEVNEAMMIHTKSLDLGQIQNWSNKCRFDFTRKHLGCHIGFPWPNNVPNPSHNHNPVTGWEYNCFVNDRVDSYWIPRLQEAMAERQKTLDMELLKLLRTN